MTHPLACHPGEILLFDSWTTLCEYSLDVAEEEAKRLLNSALVELTSRISDEIVATAEEYTPDI